MRFLTVVFSSALACAVLCIPAQAVPVTFTYTSNAVDLSDLNEDWQRAYIQGHWALGGLNGRQARISLEVDCTISSGSWSCRELQYGPDYSRALYFYDDYFNEWDVDRGSMKVVSAAGFQDRGVFARTFKVDETGQVIQWDLEGFEYNQVGDFRLSDTGDTYKWLFEDPASSWYYCYYTFEVGFDRTRNTCENGAAARSVNRLVQVGIGTWSVDASSLIVPAPVPVPGGLPLVLSGLGLFAYLRHRRSYVAG